MDELEVYPVPPVDFCKRLFEFDSCLQLNWDPGHKVWAIWQRDPYTGEVSHVMNVVNEDGSYRPLDDRVFIVLRRNRYFAQNPEELQKIICDDLEAQIAKERESAHEEMRHFSKDRTLNRKFKEIVDEAKGISWNDWKKFIPTLGDKPSTNEVDNL